MPNLPLKQIYFLGNSRSDPTPLKIGLPNRKASSSNHFQAELVIAFLIKLMKKKPNGHNEMSWPFVAQEIVSLRKKNWGVSEVFFSHQLNSTKPTKKTICSSLNYLEDHPRTCKWLITMVSKSPKWGYSPYKWLINGL